MCLVWFAIGDDNDLLTASPTEAPVCDVPTSPTEAPVGGVPMSSAVPSEALVSLTVPSNTAKAVSARDPRVQNHR